MTTPSTGSASTRKTRAAAVKPARSDSRALPGRAGCAAPAWGWPSFARGSAALPGLSLAARPGLLALTAVLLVGLCAILAARGMHSHARRAEFNLLADASSFKLKDTSAEAPPSPPAPVVKVVPKPWPPVPEVREPVLVPATITVPAPPVMPEPLAPDRMTVAPMESPRLVERPAVAEPVVFEPYFFLALHQGDSPMIRYWTMLGVPAFMAVALAADPSLAVAQTTDIPPAPLEKKVDSETAGKIADIFKDLEQIRKSLADLDKIRDSITSLDTQVQKDLKGINQDIKSINQDILNLNLKTEKAQGDIANLRVQQKDIDGLKKDLAQVQKDLEELKKRPASGTISAAYNTPSAGASNGLVRMVNTYPKPMTIVVNQKAYQVEPGETRLSEPIPAGSFIYEVLGVQEPRTRSVAANGTFTVSVHEQGR